MNINPVVASYRHFNALLLGLSLLILLVAAVKIFQQPTLPLILVATLSCVAVIRTGHHLRSGAGVVLLGCTRRTFDEVRTHILKDRPLGAVYRPGRGIGFSRELVASRRNSSVDDASLVAALKAHFLKYPQELSPRDTVLFAAWGIGLVLAVLLVAWLLLA